MKHWSENEDFLPVYHGTHIRNVPKIVDPNGPGISNKDPKTGMISVAIGDRGFDTAHAYAGMAGVEGAGGEHNFRQAGQRAVSVSHEDRAVIVAHLPMDWVHQHVDRNFGGNPDSVKERLRNPAAHDEYVRKNGEDTAFDETPELRFREAIPAKYIVGVTQKRKPMKTFKEFVEESLSEEVPTTSAGGGGDSKIKNFDPVLKFNNIVSMLKRRPPKDTFNHPETAEKDAARSASGVPGLP